MDYDMEQVTQVAWIRLTEDSMADDGEYTTRELLLAAQAGIARVTAERDKLRAALLAFKNATPSGFKGWHSKYERAIELAEAALSAGVRDTGGDHA